jgi:hypothetical protein
MSKKASIAASLRTGRQLQHRYSFLEYIYFNLQKPKKSVDNALAQH